MSKEQYDLSKQTTYLENKMFLDPAGLPLPRFNGGSSCAVSCVSCVVFSSVTVCAGSDSRGTSSIIWVLSDIMLV